MNSDISRDFFYAFDEAAIYDAIAPMTQYDYHRVLDDLVELLVLHLNANESLWRESGPVILDAGCGTGALALRILKRVPGAKVVAIDLSGRMLEELVKNLDTMAVNDQTARDRISLFEVDLIGPAGTAQGFRSLLPSGSNCYAAIVSGFVMHHFTSAHKRILYRAIQEALHADGIFLNVDLFTYSSPALAEVATARSEAWLNEQFDDPGAMYAETARALGERREAMRLEWLRHLREVNRPNAIHKAPEGAARDAEFSILSDVGFREVETPYRYDQCAIVWSRK